MEEITTTLEQDKDGAWWYVHIPLAIRQKYKQLERRGIIPIKATVGSSVWEGSILPWADGSGQVSVNKKIREKENLHLGDAITIRIEPR